MEVGGNFAMEDCWKLVDTSERTGIPCMMLENCCYGKRELMVLNMVKKGAEDKLAKVQFAQADIVKTVIRCAGGQLITLTLDTTLPRAYSRGFTVRGTKGGYWEDMDAVFLDGKDNGNDFEPKKLWDNAKDYEEEYHHPLWKNYVPIGGHDGMDFFVLQAFVEAVRKGTQTPIDVYDTATWMCISTLSEQSINTGGMPQSIPDFTRGRWMERKDISQLHYSLDV